MQATLHAIEARLTDDELAPAALANFRLGPGEAADVRRAVEEPGWSLYCLDWASRPRALPRHRPGRRPRPRRLRARNPVPPRPARAAGAASRPSTALAAAIPAPRQLILVFNIGRCGTTLVNAMLNEIEGGLEPLRAGRPPSTW